MKLPAKVIKEMAGLWEMVGEPENLDQYMRAQGKNMGARFFEKRTSSKNRTTISILFPDDNTVQSLLTIGETKKIEPITAMLNLPLPIIDPEEKTMIQLELEVKDGDDDRFLIRMTGRKYGEETMELAINDGKLTQTNTIVEKNVSCTRVYTQSDSMATDDFEISYKQRLTRLQKYSVIKTF